MTSPGSNAVVVFGGFDDLRPIHFRFFEEASKLGQVTALLWSDDEIRKISGKPPKFPLQERLYLLEAIRYINKVLVVNSVSPDSLPDNLEFKPDVWVVDENNDTPAKKAFCKSAGLKYHVLKNDKLNRFAEYNPAIVKTTPTRKKVIVTGCYDWFHSGHVRFFEEVSQLGDLYVAVGSDKTIGELKGPGHPMFSQQERVFVCQSIRYVTQTLIGTGSGWLDAEPEIHRLKPDIYTVNEDGDRPEKRDFCRKNNIEYVVLKRLPKPGLARRKSTDLRGF
jgi:cytidyltransferase-like protein